MSKTNDLASAGDIFELVRSIKWPKKTPKPIKIKWPIRFSQLSKTNDLASAGDIFELGKSQKSPKNSQKN